MLSVTKRQLGLIVRTYQTAMTALTLLGIALVSCVLHKEWIVFMTLLAFLGARQLTEEPYHCNSLVTCLAVSILVFTCILRLVPSLSWSLAAGPLIAVAIAYSSSYIPKFKKYKQYYESQTSFDIDNRPLQTKCSKLRTRLLCLKLRTVLRLCALQASTGPTNKLKSTSQPRA